MTEHPPPDEFSDGSRLLVEFQLLSPMTPALLVDGGGFIEGASPAALADLDLPPDAIRGARVVDILGFELVTPVGRRRARSEGHTLYRAVSELGAFRWRAIPLAELRLDGGWLVEFRRDLGDGTDGSLDLDERVERLDDLLSDLAERFENLNRYVGLISHDLQAPTRRLLSFVELLRGDLSASSDHDDAATASLDAIERGARHLLRLTSELLQYSRLGSRPMPLEVVDTGAVLADTLEQLDHQISEARATVEVVTPLPPVIASPTFLSVVFQNLVQNGLRYRGDAEPRIVITSSVDPETGAVRIDVRDNGIGIAPELRAAVFQPFRRLGKGDQQHSGLGLATVRDIVERFGGSISITAGASGGGTTFTVVLRSPDPHVAG